TLTVNYAETSNTVVEGCGTIVRTWTVTDTCGNAASATQTITVTDTTAPVLPELPAGGDLGCNPATLPGCVEGLTAADNCDGSVAVVCTAGAVTGDDCTKSQIFTYVATDKCGNAARDTVTYTWKVDLAAPVLSGCPTGAIDLGSNPALLPDCAAALALVTATDNCDGPITPACEAGPITDTGEGDCKWGKSQTFTLKAADLCGNISECTVIYTWREVPDVTPVITAVPNIMHGPEEFYITVRVTELNRVDTCGPITVRIPKDIRWVLAPGYDPALTMLGSTALNNSVWSYSQSDTHHIFTTTSVISAGGYSYFGFNATWDAGQTRGIYTITSQIDSWSGGEERIDNNVDAEKLNYFIY
ncbi:MAG: hypothetical protein KA118_18460, partial [Verrucomicrobia bacterium]|nr:hypothetical protein [Verrucomicrobiota bacterium]